MGIQWQAIKINEKSMKRKWAAISMVMRHYSRQAGKPHVGAMPAFASPFAHGKRDAMHNVC